MKGRALTPEQKRAIVERILACWLRRPEQRLGQLVMNARYVAGANMDCFAVEDDMLAMIVERYADVVEGS